MCDIYLRVCRAVGRRRAASSAEQDKGTVPDVTVRVGGEVAAKSLPADLVCTPCSVQMTLIHECIPNLVNYALKQLHA